MFKDGRKNVHDEERSRGPSMSDELVLSVDQKKIREMYFGNFMCIFTNVTHCSFTVKLGYHKF
jgi:hypothetical protein